MRPFLLDHSTIRNAATLAASLIASLCLCASSLAASVVFVGTSSSDFALPSVEWTNVGTGAVTTATILDNPVQGDFAYEVTISGTTAPQAVGRAFFFPTTYDPSIQGAISSINWTIEQDAVDATDIFAQGIALMLRQGGEFYRTAGDRDPVADGVFVDFSATGITANTFAHVGFDGFFLPGKPDFSASGGIIEVGLAGGFSTSGLFTPAQQEVQNFSVTINILDTSAVPEPSTAVLATLGLSLLGIIAWRRHRRS